MPSSLLRWCALSLLWIAPLRAFDLAREIVLAPQAGDAPEDRAVAEAQARAARDGAGAREWTRLGWAYVAKARRAQDAGAYKLAEKTCDVIDAQFGADEGSQLLRGHALQNLHRFAEAEKLARGLVADAATPAALALLADALMEQGKLAAAIEVLERLAQTKPGPDTEARIAHVRWLRGDLPGAIAAMESALRMTSARAAEPRAWMLTRLSGYALQAADVRRALVLADAALQEAQNYPPAQLARGRALVALGQTREAIAAFRGVVEATRSPEAQWWLADALRAAGEMAEAQRVEAALKRYGEAEDPRTLALFLATRGEAPALALRLAREELAQRADVFSHDALAWALRASGDTAGAVEAMRAARKEGACDARLALHAALIASASGDGADAAALFAGAHEGRWTLTPSERALLTANFSSQPTSE